MADKKPASPRAPWMLGAKGAVDAIWQQANRTRRPTAVVVLIIDEGGFAGATRVKGQRTRATVVDDGHVAESMKAIVDGLYKTK